MAAGQPEPTGQRLPARFWCRGRLHARRFRPQETMPGAAGLSARQHAMAIAADAGPLPSASPRRARAPGAASRGCLATEPAGHVPVASRHARLRRAQRAALAGPAHDLAMDFRAGSGQRRPLHVRQTRSSPGLACAIRSPGSRSRRVRAGQPADGPAGTRAAHPRDPRLPIGVAPAGWRFLVADLAPCVPGAGGGPRVHPLLVTADPSVASPGLAPIRPVRTRPPRGRT